MAGPAPRSVVGPTLDSINPSTCRRRCWRRCRWWSSSHRLQDVHQDVQIQRICTPDEFDDVAVVVVLLSPVRTRTWAAAPCHTAALHGEVPLGEHQRPHIWRDGGHAPCRPQVSGERKRERRAATRGKGRGRGGGNDEEGGGGRRRHRAREARLAGVIKI